MSALNDRNTGNCGRTGDHIALLTLGGILGKTSSVEEGVDLILHAMEAGFKAEECSITLLDPSNSLKVRGCIGLSEDRARAVKEWIERSGLREEVFEGEGCIAGSGPSAVGDFLVVPLEAAQRKIGFITIHKVKGHGLSEPAIRWLFSILADVAAPHLLNALSKEGNSMKNLNFHSVVESLDSGISRVKEYNGDLSVAIVRVENYARLCADLGVFEAAEHVRQLGERLAGSLNVVNDTVRINDDSIAVILPLISPEEASDLVRGIAACLPSELVLADTIVSYPQDGSTGALLLREAYRHRIN